MFFGMPIEPANHLKGLLYKLGEPIEVGDFLTHYWSIRQVDYKGFLIQ